uniref:Uncharacterized protein n=1 Tax=Panagrolaimus davidi TaxID=227884 RepID=A0A914QK73_9BILA
MLEEYTKTLSAECEASFLRLADEEYALYISPTLLETLRKTLKLKGDGRFKYTPKGYRLIFRLFGWLKNFGCYS